MYCINKYTFLFLLFSVMILANMQTFLQYERQLNDKLYISSSKNLTLLHCILMISQSGERIKSQYADPFEQEVRQYFYKFRNHEAVQLTDEIFQISSFYLLNYVALSHTDFPEAEYLGNKVYNLDKLMKFLPEYVKAVRSFYYASDFEKFWISHSDQILKVIDVFSDQLFDLNILSVLQDFYGEKVDRFHVVIAPFLQSSAFSTVVNDYNGRRNFYFIYGSYKNDFRGITDNFLNTSFAIHEYSHCFLEHIINDYFQQLDSTKHLFQPLLPDLAKIGYPTWQRVFAEHLVLACQLVIINKIYGEEAMKRLLSLEEDHGFRALKIFYDLIIQYDYNRKQYENFSSFFPQILDELSNLEAVKTRKPAKLGFYSVYYGGKLWVTKVIPGSTAEATGMRAGDQIYSIARIRIDSAESMEKAIDIKNNAKEGDRIDIIFLRKNGKYQIKRNTLIPFEETIIYKLIE